MLGARGTLGVALCQEMERLGRSVAGVGHGECDIRDAAAVGALVDRVNPSVVFNAAAYTDVDRAEAEPELAQAVNADGAAVVARAAAAAGAAVVHYSTDFVFDGELERPYDELDPPSPQGAYARSKVAGDAAVAAAAPRHFIVRVGCLYGRGGRNFPVDDRAAAARGRDRAGGQRADRLADLGEARWRAPRRRWRATDSTASITARRRARPAGPTSPLHARPSWGCPRAGSRRAVVGAAAEGAAPAPGGARQPHARLRGLDTLSTWQDAARRFHRRGNAASIAPP